MVNRTLDSGLKGTALSMTIDQNHHFLGCHYCTYTYGQSGLGHLVDVILEETGVGNDGVGSQGLLTGTAGEAGTRLVEGNVAIRANTAEEQVVVSTSNGDTTVSLACLYYVRSALDPTFGSNFSENKQFAVAAYYRYYKAALAYIAAHTN